MLGGMNKLIQLNQSKSIEVILNFLITLIGFIINGVP
jgi:hypothetical protein